MVEFISGDVETVKYDETTNDFLVVRNNGRIKTMFKPKNGKEYYEAEKRKDLR